METNLFKDEKKERDFYDGKINLPQKAARTEIRMVTPEMAKNWLTVNTINRNVNKNLVAHYARQMKEGLWEFTGEPIIFSSNKLLDGQHRLLALISANMPITFLCVFNINEDTFKVIDTGKARSIGEIFDISGIKNYTCVSAGIRKFFALKSNLTPTGGVSNKGKISGTSISLIDNQITPKELLDFYYKYELFISDLATRSISMYNSSKLLTKSEIIGYILYLCHYKNHNEKSVYHFFESITTGKDTSNNILYSLRNKLIAEKSSTRKMPGSFKNALIVKAWNTYITGKNLKTLRYDPENEPKPEFI